MKKIRKLAQSTAGGGASAPPGDPAAPSPSPALPDLSAAPATAQMGVARSGAKTGAELVKETDTQGLMATFWANAGKNEDGSKKTWEQLTEAQRAELLARGVTAEKYGLDRKFYADTVDGAAGTQIKSSDFGSKDFDALRGLERGFAHRPDRKYFNGWSEDNHVVLLYKDPKTGKKRKEKILTEYYVWIHDEEKQKLPPEKWRWLRDRDVILKIEQDPFYPEYWKIYIDNVSEQRYVTGTAARELRKGSATRRTMKTEDIARRTYALLGERGRPVKFPRERERDTPKQRALRYLQKHEIDVLEADLTVKQRWVTDNDIIIEDEYRECYFDLETDDTIGGFDNKEENYILSIGWKNNTKIGEREVLNTEGKLVTQEVTEEDVILSASATDEGEALILKRFRLEVLDRHDVLIAWNGWNFDFPVLIGRYEYHQFRLEDEAEAKETAAARFRRRDPVRAAALDEEAKALWAEAKQYTLDWRYWLFNDLLPVFKRHYIRAASAASSFSLDNIGKNVLKMSKVDWKSVYRERHPEDPKPPKKIIELFHKDPDLLAEYNKYDVDILYNLEKFTGFAKMEQTFCRIGNCFANDFNISTKIDGLMLKKGYKEGMHFPTRWLREGDADQYEGAYVFDPVKGVHHYVCAFDFKSLYPSMMTAFNISPDTWVPQYLRSRFLKEHPADGCVPGCIPEVTINDEGRQVLTVGTCTGHFPDLILCPISLETFRKDRQGYIPQMFKETLFKRKKYTDLQATEEVGSDMFLLYYRLAYSFKRLGLSFYGELGNQRSRYYFPSVAESVTLSGQYFIRETAHQAELSGYRPLYGDTDSIYISLLSDEEADTFVRNAEAAGEDPSIAILEEVNRRGAAFVKHCQAYYKANMVRTWNYNPSWDMIELEFEDIYDIIFFVSKKRYAGRMLGHKGQKSDVVEIKGLEAMRSDYVELTRVLQRRVLDLILRERAGAADVMKEVRQFREVFFGRAPRKEGEPFDAEKIAVTKSIGKDPDEYVKMKPLHVQLAATIKADGREFYVGMKVPHIVTNSNAKVETGELTKTGKPKTKKMMQGVLLEKWTPEQGYDALYYWDRVIFPASERVLNICYPGHDWTGLRAEIGTKRERKRELYGRALRDPRRRDKAREMIKKDKLLGPDDLAYLRKVWALGPEVKAPRATRKKPSAE